jgi:hypothetical protein
MSVNKKQYWDSEIERLAIECVLETDLNRKAELYLKIRPAFVYMISSIIYKKRFIADHDDWVVEFETDLYLSVFCGTTFDPTKSKLYSYLTRCIYNAIAKKWKERFIPKNCNLSWEHANEDNGELWEPTHYDVQYSTQERHEMVIEEIEQGLWEIVPRYFSKRGDNYEILVHTARLMISKFRERPYKRIITFKHEVLEEDDKATRNSVERLAKMFKDEYSRKIKESRFDEPSTWVFNDRNNTYR